MVAPRRLSILPQAVGVLRGRSRHRGVGWRRGRECVNHGRDGHVVEGSKLYARSTGASVRALRPSADRVAALGHRRDGLAGGGPDRGIAPRVASKQPDSTRLRGAATRDLRPGAPPSQSRWPFSPLVAELRDWRCWPRSSSAVSASCSSWPAVRSPARSPRLRPLSVRSNARVSSCADRRYSLQRAEAEEPIPDTPVPAAVAVRHRRKGQVAV
jgi:hypothetical protein